MKSDSLIVLLLLGVAVLSSSFMGLTVSSLVTSHTPWNRKNRYSTR